MTTLGQRLIEARASAGLTQTELAELVGMSQQAIADIEVDKTKRPRAINEIAAACGVSVEFLLGRPEASALKQRTKLPAVYVEGEEGLKFLKEFDLRAGASYGGGQIDSEWNEDGISGHQPIEKWGFPSAFVERELGLSAVSADIIRVRGDSMDDGTAKGLSSGDRVIIDRADTDVRQGGIFAVFDGEGVIVKQVELIRGEGPPRIVCKSRNTSYDPIQLILESPVRVIGRVAGRISRV